MNLLIYCKCYFWTSPNRSFLLQFQFWPYGIVTISWIGDNTVRGLAALAAGRTRAAGSRRV